MNQPNIQDENTRKQWLHILKLIKPYWRIIPILPFLIGVDIAFELGVAKVQGLFIDTIGTGNTTQLFDLLKFVGSLLVAALILLGVHRFLITLILMNVHRDLTAKLFNKINGYRYQTVKKYHSGDLITRVKDDVQHGADVIEATIEFVTVLIIILLSFVYLASIDVFLALLGLMGAPLLFLVGRFFDNSTRKTSNEVQEQESRLREHLQEYLQGLAIIKSYGVASLFTNKFLIKREELNKSQTKLDLLKNTRNATTELCFDLVHIGALLFIGVAAVRDSLTPGVIVTFSILFELVVWPVIGMSDQYGRVQEGLGAFRRIFELLNITNKQEERCDYEKNVSREDVSNSTPVIELENVSFLSESIENYILKNINLKLHEGEIVVVVGASGSGKSTLAKICCGLYKPTKGEAWIKDKMASEWLAREEHNFTAVNQFPFMFKGSLKENICLSNTEVPEDSYIQAAKMAHLHDVIMRFDTKYDESVGENGSKLSGGQKQRLALTRAFLRNSDIIILDEPTSSLDMELETKVLDSLRTFLHGKSALIVSHRMAFAQLADRIIVIDNGFITEEGTHDELMNNNGIYRRFSTLE